MTLIPQMALDSRTLQTILDQHAIVASLNLSLASQMMLGLPMMVTALDSRALQMILDQHAILVSLNLSLDSQKMLGL